VTPPTVSLAGVCPVLVTPFDERLRILTNELASQVEWVVAAGARAVVYPGVVSEFFTLGERERRESVGAVVEAAAGRVPVVAGVSAPSGPVAAELARRAEEVGAAAVMAMTPYVPHFFAPTKDDAIRYYTAIADACALPIVLQNARIGHPLAPPVVVEIVERLPAVRYVKEENFPSTHTLAAAIEALGDRVDGVFGGLGGVYLAQELERGAVGTMPSPALADVLVAVYRLWSAGDRHGADELLTGLRGFFTLELLYNVALVKEVLRRRGVISSVATRVPAPVLDAVDLAEIAALLERLPVPAAT
jgi:dihydrodipicolinate synthase/N-acetylneuraminate lyase